VKFCVNMVMCLNRIRTDTVGKFEVMSYKLVVAIFAIGVVERFTYV